MLRLQQQQLAALKVDRVYDDRLSDAISDELWTEKSAELQEQLRRVRAEMERHDGARSEKGFYHSSNGLMEWRVAPQAGFEPPALTVRGQAVRDGGTSDARTRAKR